MRISTARSTREWVEYFRMNRSRLVPIPWALGAELDAAERAAITSSIQAFQLGESEGRSQEKEMVQREGRPQERSDASALELRQLFGLEFDVARLVAEDLVADTAQQR